MKTLCLTVILANIFLLMWEYRSGGFTENKVSPEQHATYGKEQIFLLHELKKQPQPPAALKPIRDIQPSLFNLSNDIKDIPLKAGEQNENPQIKLP